MSKKNDGGPINHQQRQYVEGHGWLEPSQPGMSLLDHYAGLAMQALLTNMSQEEQAERAMGSYHGHEEDLEQAAKRVSATAFAYARAMIEKRNSIL